MCVSRFSGYFSLWSGIQGQGQIAAGFPTREAILTELTLDPPNATSEHAGVPHRDEDFLILPTMHSAKGQEWKSVHLLNDLATGNRAD